MELCRLTYYCHSMPTRSRSSEHCTPTPMPNGSGERLTDPPGDLQVLARRDHQGAHGGALGAQLPVGVAAEVGGIVDGDAEEAEAVGGQPPDLRRVLADAAGEHQHVQAAR